MKPALSLLAALGLVAAFAASAQTSDSTASTTTQPTSREQAQHARIDANGDGFIDRQEAASRPHLKDDFDRIDSNHDDQLSRDELRNFRTQRMNERMQTRKEKRDEHFTKADTDQDGMLSKTEFEASHGRDLEQRFNALDANKDGQISRDELEAKAGEMYRRHGNKAGTDKAEMK